MVQKISIATDCSLKFFVATAYQCKLGKEFCFIWPNFEHMLKKGNTLQLKLGHERVSQCSSFRRGLHPRIRSLAYHLPSVLPTHMQKVIVETRGNHDNARKLTNALILKKRKNERK